MSYLSEWLRSNSTFFSPQFLDSYGKKRAELVIRRCCEFSPEQLDDICLLNDSLPLPSRQKKSPSTADLVIASSTDQNVVLESKSIEGSDTAELCWQIQHFPPKRYLLLVHWAATSPGGCHLLQQDTQGAESMTALPNRWEGKRRRKEWSLQDEQCTKMPAGILEPLPCSSWLQFPSPTGCDSNPSLFIYSPPPEICLWIMQALHSPGFICQKVACGPRFAF